MMGRVSSVSSDEQTMTLEELSAPAFRCWQRVHAAFAASDPRNPDDPSVNLDTLAALLHAALSENRDLAARLAETQEALRVLRQYAREVDVQAACVQGGVDVDAALAGPLSEPGQTRE